MLIVTYDLNNTAGMDLILPEIRRFKTVRLSKTTFALVATDDVREVERFLHDKLLPGDRIWIFTIEGPYRELEFELPPDTVIH